MEGLDPEEIAELALGRLKNKKPAILKALEGYRLSDRDLFLLTRFSVFENKHTDITANNYLVTTMVTSDLHFIMIGVSNDIFYI